jgi:RNA polymerase sigma-70 factor, ECF subfamily
MGTVSAEVDDGLLVGRAQSGDGEAYAELYRRHYRAVVRACTRRLGGHRGEAEEIAQAAFVRGFERIGLCAGEQRFGAWVQVIARHLCADAARARARPLPSVLDVPAAVAGSPEEHALQLERLETLRSAISRLPSRQRQVLVARDVEGRRPTEIAAALGVSLGAVDSLLLRARRSLAAGYRSMAAEQGVATVASSAVAAAATGGLAGGPGRVWRSLARGVEAVRSALLGLANRVPAHLGTTVAAGVAAVGMAVPANTPATDGGPRRDRAAVSVPAPLIAPVPDQGLGTPIPATPSVPPAPEAPPVPRDSQLPPPPHRHPMGEALGLLDAGAALDTVVVPMEPPSRVVPERPGRALRQEGREAWRWTVETGRETGREMRHQARPG